MPIFIHVYVVAPPRYRLAGRKTDARENDIDGSLVDTHQRDKGENSDVSRPELASWWQAKRRKNFPSPIVTTVTNVTSGFKSQSLAGAQTSPSKLSTFSLGRSLWLPGLRLYIGSTIFQLLILLSYYPANAQIPGLYVPAGYVTRMSHGMAHHT